MHGLLGDRLLKWLIGSMSRKPTPTAVDEEDSRQENEKEGMCESDIPETKEIQRKEGPEDSEKVDVE